MTDIELILRKRGNDSLLSQIRLPDEKNLFNDLLAKLNSLKGSHGISRFDIYYEDNKKNKFPIGSNEDIVKYNNISGGKLRLFVEDVIESKLFENFDCLQEHPSATSVAHGRAGIDQAETGVKQKINVGNIRPCSNISYIPAHNPALSTADPIAATMYPPPFATSANPSQSTTYPTSQINTGYPPPSTIYSPTQTAPSFLPPTTIFLSPQVPSTYSPVPSARPSQSNPIFSPSSATKNPEIKPTNSPVSTIYPSVTSSSTSDGLGSSISPVVTSRLNDAHIFTPPGPVDMYNITPKYNETLAGTYGYYDDYDTSFTNYCPSITCETYQRHYHTPTTWYPESQYGCYNSYPGASYSQAIFCDNCQLPITGIRFKCVVCPDYDLCNLCDSRGIHTQHNMVRLMCYYSALTGGLPQDLPLHTRPFFV